MSFASGLFSFMGGASSQFREEIDLKNAQEAARKEAEALAYKEEQERLREDYKFETETSLREREIGIQEGELDLKKLTEQRLGYEFKATHGLDLKYFEWEKEQWHDTYTLQRDDYNLKKRDLEEKLKLAKNADERAETLLSLDVLEQNWSQAQDKIQNQFQIDDLEFKKYKFEVENDVEIRKALEEANEGIIEFGPDLTFNKGSFEAKEQPAAFLTWAEYNLTKEKIDELDEGGLLSLATEFNIATEKMILASKQQDGSIIDLADDKYNNAFAMIKHIPGAISLKQQIKNAELKDEKNKNADSVIVNAEKTADGKTKITTEPISYEKIAIENGFDSEEEFLNSIDSLVNITKEKVASPLYVDDLNPFEDRDTLIASLKNKNINLSVLKLATHVNNIQEASYTNIGVATDYNMLVEKAFEFGILTRDDNNNIQGESQLIDFIFMMQPKEEYATKSGLEITPASDDPEKYGLKETINSKDSKAQNDSSLTAIATAIKLKDVLNDPSSDKIGLALNIAAKVYGITTQYQQLASLWSGSTNTFNYSLKTGDGSNDRNTGGISETKQIEINKEILDAQNILNSNTALASAKKKAKMTLLKFTLAYQVSMALQGGSGGRTISDQDVDNILQSLAMPDTFFSTATKESTTASLNTLVEYLEGVELQSRYLSQNTMKGYRTYVATNQILSALNNYGGTGTDLESLKEQMHERHDIGPALTEEGKFDWGTEYTNNYRKTWGVDFTANNVPVYVIYENGRVNKKESYVMDETEWSNFLSAAQANNNNMFDDVNPNFSTDIEKESYGGFRVKGLFSEAFSEYLDNLDFQETL